QYSGMAPARLAAASSFSAAALGQIAMGRFDPPARARSGNAAMARPALPKRASKWRKVTGPTFSLRIKRKRARRSSSVVVGGGASAMIQHHADLAIIVN